MDMKAPHIELDHLVVAAATLEQGVQWSHGVLGVAPEPGGVHPLMGTRNRLARLSCAAYPNCYLEIIAIDPELVPTKPVGQARWFGLDEASLRARLRSQGPQLIHAVARVPRLDDALAVCAQHGVDPGVAHAASRPTPLGLLEWAISIAPDGQPAAHGVWPTLIAWGETHPTHHMPASGLVLQDLQLWHPQADILNRLWLDLGGAAPRFKRGAPQLRAQISSPRGSVYLQSGDLSPALDKSREDML